MASFSNWLPRRHNEPPPSSQGRVEGGRPETVKTKRGRRTRDQNTAVAVPFVLAWNQVDAIPSATAVPIRVNGGFPAKIINPNAADFLRA